jgi:hypothetical protein
MMLDTVWSAGSAEGGARKDCSTDRERDYQCLMVFHAARCQRPYFLDVWRI